jgi:hypothetical protein
MLRVTADAIDLVMFVIFDQMFHVLTEMVVVVLVLALLKTLMLLRHTLLSLFRSDRLVHFILDFEEIALN